MRAHIDRIHVVCRRLCANSADAEDATQDTLIAVIKGLPRFDGRSSFSTWVHRVATNTCIDGMRRRRRRPQVVRGVGERGRIENDGSRAGATIDPADPSVGADDRVPDRMAIDDALAALPEEFRVAVVLRDALGLDYAEIAEVLGLPPGTVRSRIARGRGRLAEMLTEADPDGNPRTGDDVQGATP